MKDLSEMHATLSVKPGHNEEEIDEQEILAVACR